MIFYLILIPMGRDESRPYPLININSGREQLGLPYRSLVPTGISSRMCRDLCSRMNRDDGSDNSGDEKWYVELKANEEDRNRNNDHGVVCFFKAVRFCRSSSMSSRS